MEFFERLSEKGSDKEAMADEFIRSPESIDVLFDGLSHPKGSVRFGCEKVLRLISEKEPKLLLKYFDVFAEMLHSDNSFLKWGAIITLANLACVDGHRKFEAIIDEYFAPITEKNMITAANVVGHSWKIARARPELADRIVDEMLNVETTKYERKGEVSPECNRVVSGKAVDAFGKFFDVVGRRKPVLEFVARQLDNPRQSVAKKAARFLKKNRPEEVG